MIDRARCDLDAVVYAKVEKIVRPIMLSNAKRFCKQLDMTLDDAMQEARIALIQALPHYDYNASRGGMFKFMKKAVKRHFLKLWSHYGTQGRQPHVRVPFDEAKAAKARGQVAKRKTKKNEIVLRMNFVDIGLHRVDGLGDEQGRTLADYTADFMDLFESPLSPPDAPIEEIEREHVLTRFQAALMGMLSERDQKVLLCKIDPPRNFRLLMLDELTAEPTVPLICRYLKLSKNEVDWAIRRIRDAALELIGREFSDMTDLTVVRSYVERRQCLR